MASKSFLRRGARETKCFLTNWRRFSMRLSCYSWAWIWIHYNIIKVSVDPWSDPQSTLTKSWRNSLSVTVQTYEKLRPICFYPAPVQLLQHNNKQHCLGLLSLPRRAVWQGINKTLQFWINFCFVVGHSYFNNHFNSITNNWRKLYAAEAWGKIRQSSHAQG